MNHSQTANQGIEDIAATESREEARVQAALAHHAGELAQLERQGQDTLRTAVATARQQADAEIARFERQEVPALLKSGEADAETQVRTAQALGKKHAASVVKHLVSTLTSGSLL